MPTYEYECTKCGHHFERFSLKMSDPTPVVCPECEGPSERLISGGAGFLFKGSGFYITDYRSESYQKAAEKEQKPSGEAKDKTPSKDKASPGSGSQETQKSKSKKDTK